MDESSTNLLEFPAVGKKSRENKSGCTSAEAKKCLPLLSPNQVAGASQEWSLERSYNRNQCIVPRSHIQQQYLFNLSLQYNCWQMVNKWIQNNTNLQTWGPRLAHHLLLWGKWPSPLHPPPTPQSTLPPGLSRELESPIIIREHTHTHTSQRDWN